MPCSTEAVRKRKERRVKGQCLANEKNVKDSFESKVGKTMSNIIE